MKGFIFLAFVSFTLILSGCVETETGGDITFESTTVSTETNTNKRHFQDLAEKYNAQDRGVYFALKGQTDTSLNNDIFDSLYDDIWTIPDTYLTDGIDILARNENFTALLMAAGGSIAMRQSGADDRI